MADVVVLGDVRASAEGDSMLISAEEVLRQTLMDMEAGTFEAEKLLVIGVAIDGGILEYRWRAAKMHASDMMVACDLVKRDAMAAIE